MHKLCKSCGIRYIQIALLCLVVALSITANAQSDLFEYLDNEIFLGGGLDMQGPYSSSVYDTGVNLLSQNIWVSALVNGITSYQTTSYQPYLINNGSVVTGKVGYSFIMDNQFNVVPYAGLGYGSQSDTFHSDSDPIYTSNTTNINMIAGVHPEWAVNDSTKLTLDTSFVYSNQAQIVPNTASTLVHSDLENCYIIANPSIQWNPFGRFSIEAYYQLPVMLTNNMAPYSLEIHGFNSQTLVSEISNPGQVIGVRFGYLF